MTICVQQVDIKYQDIWAGLASQESQIRTHTVADIGIDQNGNYIYQMLPDPQIGKRLITQTQIVRIVRRINVIAMLSQGVIDFGHLLGVAR